MTKTIKSLIYFGFSISIISNFLLYGKIKKQEADYHLQEVMVRGADHMYRSITNCEFVPPAFNPPIYFQTKDGKEVGMNIRHVLKDVETKALTEEYKQKTKTIIDILEKEVKKHTLDTLKANKQSIEETVINTYNNQTIEPVVEFSILELCL